MRSAKSSPSILIITTPIRPIPTTYPPLGSLSILTVLKKAGYHDVEFYNIDYLRPKYADAVAHIKARKPDILGISAVVSTAYEYSKKLSLDIKEALPDTTILLGGNLGASAEILLKKTGVDFVCTGEGELTIVDFVSCWVDAQSRNDFKQVKGLAYLDNDQSLVVTPFPEAIKPDQVYDIDWSILDKLGETEFFIPTLEVNPTFGNRLKKNPRALEHIHLGKRYATLAGSKGCVARCTFCHRWDKGIRYIPVTAMMERIDSLIQNYNVGFISFADENFGTDRKWLAHFIQEIKKRDIHWQVGGMRVNTITREAIKKMKDAGCVYIQFGMESGSQKMLDIMEKVTKVEQNYNTIKWLAENNLSTIVQLIIGMPGETPETIRETIDFVAYVVEQSPDNDPNGFSINFAQALPGTPLYEAGRRTGKIGQSIDAEENYLIEVSDKDARDGESYINLTDYPKLYLEKWHFDIVNTARYKYVQKWGLDRYHDIIMRSERFSGLKEKDSFDLVEQLSADSGYFADPARQSEIGFNSGAEPSPWSLLKQGRVGAMGSFYPIFFWKTRGLNFIYVLLNSARKGGLKYGVKLLKECLIWKINSLLNQPTSYFSEYISLRKFIRKKLLPDIPDDDPSMSPLRNGR